MFREPIMAEEVMLAMFMVSSLGLWACGPG
jgi:hypothetical protein